jgi:hypothetical protein
MTTIFSTGMDWMVDAFKPRCDVTNSGGRWRIQLKDVKRILLERRRFLCCSHGFAIHKFDEGSEMRSQVDVAKQESSVKEIRIAHRRWQTECRIAYLLKALPQLASEGDKRSVVLAERNPLDWIEEIRSL